MYGCFHINKKNEEERIGNECTLKVNSIIKIFAIFIFLSILNHLKADTITFYSYILQHTSVCKDILHNYTTAIHIVRKLTIITECLYSLCFGQYFGYLVLSDGNLIETRWGKNEPILGGILTQYWWHHMWRGCRKVYSTHRIKHSGESLVGSQASLKNDLREQREETGLTFIVVGADLESLNSWHLRARVQALLSACPVVAYKMRGRYGA